MLPMVFCPSEITDPKPVFIIPASAERFFTQPEYSRQPIRTYIYNMHTQSSDHPFTAKFNPDMFYSKTMNVALLNEHSERTKRIQEYVVRSGSQCTVYHSVAVLQKSLRKVAHNVIMLDWDQSSGDATKNFIVWIRNTHNSDIPVIATSNSTCEHTIVDALYSGADTFFVLPLGQNELVARLHALVRRARPEREVLTYPPYSVDVSNQEVRIDNEVVSLTHLEYQLTVFLFLNRGQVLSRKQLLASIWNMPTSINTRTVDTHISHLRSKLRIRDTQNWNLTSVYQRGYCLEQHIDGL